jgi:ATP-dependent Lon protease
LLDELDKVGADFRGDPAAALLEVLDPAQNNTFTDHYLDLPFDLVARAVHRHRELARPDSSRVARPAGSHRTAELHRVGKIADRQTLSRAAPVGGTRPDAKRREIFRRRVAQLIREYTREAGVRQLEREIAALARKAARKIVAPKRRGQTVKLDTGRI